MSKIIFLNGCSSSGKSLIVKSIQELSNEPWLNFSLDIFFRALPLKYLIGEKSNEGVQFISQGDKGKIQTEIESGEYGKRVGQLIPKIFKLSANEGHNLILDEAVWEREEMEEYALTLKDHKVYFVKVTCELEIAEEREKIRGNRVWGLARDQYNKIESLGLEYDLVVDTSWITSFKTAEKILDFVKTKEPQAFAKLRKTVDKRP